MRVAVVAERTARHEETDAATRLSGLVATLTDRGHDVAVFCSQWWEGGPEVPTFDADGVTYRAVTYDYLTPGWRFALRLPRRIRRFDPDVIHAVHDPPVAVFGARLARGLARVPLVVDWYEHRPREDWRERLRRRAARTPDRVIVPSRLVETGVLELGCPPEVTEVVPGSVDMDAIRNVEPDPAADVVYSRRLDADANVESLLLALAELRTVDWSAAVIGEGPERERYEEMARDLRIDDRVDFLGDQPIERRLALFRGAHVAVHTAFRAPFAHEFLRALACGCVGIAEYHAESSAHELIERRDRGARVTDEAELAEEIEGAADHDRMDVDESFAAFDESAVVEQYLECYREVQSERGLL
jgi:glycosyltransferase involved in cell wall biosynthesis